LTNNRRQEEAWEREALDTLRDGVASEAIRVYAAHERLVIGGDRNAVVARLVKDWWAAGSDERTAMIALRRADVRELNVQARALLREADLIGPDVRLPCGTFAVGDRVVLRRNDRRLGVVNGEVGLIEAIDGRSGITVRIRDRRVRLPLWYLESASARATVQHAYAITGHVAQGMTVERAFVLGSPEMYREWGYTAMSRGRHENRLYVVAPDDLERQEVAPRDRNLLTARDSLVRGLSTSCAHTIALDTGQRQEVRAASSESLKRRLRQLGRPSPDAAVTVARADHADAIHKLERLKRELRATTGYRSRLERSQPSILRPRRRARHRADLRSSADECRALAEVVARQDEVVQTLTSRLQACREAQVERELPSRIERQLVEEELTRRASMERYVSTEITRVSALNHEPIDHSGVPEGTLTRVVRLVSDGTTPHAPLRRRTQEE